MNVTESEAREIVSALRTGAVPRAGLHHFATGLDALMDVVEGEFDFVAEGAGRGLAKWVRGDYGSGKTFATRLLCARARAKRFATAEVQVSINDTPLHKLETVYRRLIERLTTDAEGSGAFKAVVDGWLFEVGEEVSRLKGLAEDDPGFTAAVEERLEDKLADLSALNPAFAQSLRAYHRLMQEGELGLSQGVLGWLAGQPHVDRSITARAGVKGTVDGQAALAFLRGLLLLLRQSGHRGLVVVLDEAETVQRMPSQTREKALNALRQLVDMLLNGELPGLYLVVTGTRDFFEGYKGLKALAPLHQRVQISFGEDPKWDNLRAPQVRLLPFTEERLLTVGRRVRDLYPSQGGRVAARVNDTFLQALVGQVTSGFGGKVSLAPRLFLRELVDVMDRVDLHPDYDPAAHYQLDLEDGKLTPEELAAKHGKPIEPAEAEEEGQAKPAEPTRRLDG